jgi:hypothetical protein
MLGRNWIAAFSIMTHNSPLLSSVVMSCRYTIFYFWLGPSQPPSAWHCVDPGGGCAVTQRDLRGLAQAVVQLVQDEFQLLGEFKIPVSDGIKGFRELFRLVPVHGTSSHHRRGITHVRRSISCKACLCMHVP